MGWKEKIKRYRDNVELTRAERLEKVQEEKNLLAEEKSPELVNTLKELGIQDLLTSIRNDFWKLGEVRTSVFVPEDDSDIFSKYEIAAKVSLVAQWPKFVPAHSYQDSYLDGFNTVSVPDHIEIIEELLEVVTFHDSSGEIQFKLRTSQFDKSFSDRRTRAYFCDQWYRALQTSDPKVKDKLEEYLVKESIKRQSREPSLPYNLASKKAEVEIISAIRTRGFVPDQEDYKYLLDLARSQG